MASWEVWYYNKYSYKCIVDRGNIEFSYNSPDYYIHYLYIFIKSVHSPSVLTHAILSVYQVSFIQISIRPLLSYRLQYVRSQTYNYIQTLKYIFQSVCHGKYRIQNTYFARLGSLHLKKFVMQSRNPLSTSQGLHPNNPRL